MSKVEWATRLELAACYRLIAFYGMICLVYTHITARFPGPVEYALTIPYGMLYEEIAA